MNSFMFNETIISTNKYDSLKFDDNSNTNSERIKNYIKLTRQLLIRGIYNIFIQR